MSNLKDLLDVKKRFEATKWVVDILDTICKPVVWYTIIMLIVECSLFPNSNGRTSHWYFLWSERLVAGIFTFEYLFRCWRNSGRGFYPTTAFGIIDLIAILPFWLGFLPFMAPYLHIVRTLRILRMLKFFRYSRDLQLMALGFYRAYFNLKPLIYTMVMVIIFTMFALYEIEGPHQEEFRDLFTVGWFLEVTGTTVGYGDMSPQTTAGKVIVMTFMIVGLAIFAACFSAISSAFSKVFEEEADPNVDPIEEFKKERLHRRLLKEIDRNTGTTVQEDAEAEMEIKKADEECKS